jgi:hypothetical protein
MAEETAFKTLTKELKDNRKETIATLNKIIEDNKKIVDNTNSTKEEIKAAAKDQLKAAKARDALQKMEVTLGKDLKKNFADIGATITGGLDGILSETFGPLGGIASSLTVGFFKRRQENKKNLESDQMQVDATQVLTEEMQTGKEATAKAETAGGELGEVAVESAEETAGGVQEVGEGLGTTNQLLTDIEGHLSFMAGNQESAEDRRERLRSQKAKRAGGTVVGGGGKAGMDGDESDWSFLEMMGLSKMLGLTSLLSGKGGLISNIFRNVKAILLKSARKFGGGGGAKLMQGILKGIGLVAKIGAIAGVLIAPIIDGILGYFKAEEWGVSKLSGIIGGILGGGEGGGINAIFNGMKWAAAGAAAGTLILPGVGTIIGGIAGAILGAILGFFGGNKIAKVIDDIGGWIKDKFDNILKFLGLEKKTEEDFQKELQDDKDELDEKVSILGIEKERLDKIENKTPMQRTAAKRATKDLEEAKTERTALDDPDAIQKYRKTQTTTTGVGTSITTFDKEGKATTTEYLGGDQSDDKEFFKIFNRDGSASRLVGASYRHGPDGKKSVQELKLEKLGYTRETFAALKDEEVKNVIRSKIINNEVRLHEQGLASGGIIVTKPTYLPASGVVVGESPSWSGPGLARGGIPTIPLSSSGASGRKEAVIPLESEAGGQILAAALAPAIAGATLNEMALARVGTIASYNSQSPVITDASSNQTVINQTTINSPNPQGPSLPGSGRDMAVSHFRHVA